MSRIVLMSRRVLVSCVAMDGGQRFCSPLWWWCVLSRRDSESGAANSTAVQLHMRRLCAHGCMGLGRRGQTKGALQTCVYMSTCLHTKPKIAIFCTSFTSLHVTSFHFPSLRFVSFLLLFHPIPSLPILPSLSVSVPPSTRLSRSIRHNLSLASRHSLSHLITFPFTSTYTPDHGLLWKQTH
ncbi:hypothetical protein EDD21DRAFT_184128 [Dissophora ornata]|nr:hypothetical protein EDD21DRAFT_184128 [Dissophora ornata]